MSAIISSEKLNVSFVLKLAKAMHEAGLPTHRLEEGLTDLCTKIGLEAEFFCTPGSIFASIKENGNFNAHLIKVHFSDLNLEKIDALEKLSFNFTKKEISTENALKELDLIQKGKALYSNFVMTLFFAISTGSAACVFGGKFPEIICSFLIGLGIGAMFSSLSIFPRLGKVIVLISAVWAVLVSSFFQTYFIGFKQDIATICGLIILIPGFSFTISITEMVNNHLIAGISRFTSAFINFMMIAIGVGVGSKIMDQIQVASNPFAELSFPFYVKWIALIFVPLGFVVLFKAKMKDFVWIALACWTSYFMYSYTSKLTHPVIAVFISSFTLGIVSNLFAILRKRNVSLMLVPGMILLVPGSLGFFSISQLLHSNTLAGINTALEMLATSLALVFGLIFANIFVSVEKIKT
ncbi:MAG: threonine/serine exporter ThrE family protein [Flavobacteriia bacterium]|jgi:uncharacterized membrane protein YjjP (DUF1212 family)